MRKITTMHEFSKSLGDAIKRNRKKAGLTQKELSITLNMDYRTLQNIETYQSNPTMEKIYPLIRYLKVNSQEIFFPELFESSPCLNRIRLILAECSEEEAEVLIPIIEAVISALRKNGTPPVPVQEKSRASSP